MNVAELIAILQTLPQDATVGYVWDGEVRSEVDHAWLSRDGKAVLSGSQETVYSEESRPASAPTSQQDRYWQTPRVARDDENGW